MNKKVSLGAAIAIAVAAVAITFSITVDVMTDRFNSQMGEMQSLRSLYGKLQEISAYVNDSAFFKPTDVQREENIAAAYAAALRQAGDKYARYYTAEAYAEDQKQTAGQEGGFGLTVMDSEDKMYIYNVSRNSPAYNAGLRPGDSVTVIKDANGVIIARAEYGYEKMTDALLCKTGETRVLTVLQEDGSEKDISVTSAAYANESVWVEYSGEIAVVRIIAFNSDTDERFIEIINSLEKNAEVKGIVFDLRNNPGGLLSTVVNMLDRLLPEGVIVTETKADGTKIAEYKSDAKRLDRPMAVLTNGSTASAAELFSCALRDYGKAKLIGEATYGKGCVQTTFVLSDGSAICFTTALYEPPSGKNYEGIPIKPDTEIKLTEEQELKFYSLNAETDPQLKEAINQLSPDKNSANAA